MPNCCGEYRTSRFCPDCGKALESDPMAELLSHIRRTIRSKRTAIENGYDDQDHAIEKWERWEKALEALLNQKNP